MALNFNRYKTYDTSTGYGNSKQWRESFYQRMTGQEAEAIVSASEKDPWQILGVKHGSPLTDIKAAFRKLIQEWHPDRNQHRELEATEMSKRIIAAYTLLTTE